VAQNRSRFATLLVVEDEPLLRIDLADMLSNMGYTVLAAPDSEAAIKLLETCPKIIAVITDRNMPGTMDGLALAHVVRKRWPPCALLMVSGEHRPSENEFPAGMRFLSKPVNAPSLQATLEELGAGLI
jgi:CheY-like chemotaxis protein